MSRKLEHFVTDVVGLGRFQLFLASAAYVVCTVPSWCTMIGAFLNFNPGWTCDYSITDADIQDMNISTSGMYNSEPPGNQTFHPGTIHQDTSNSSTEDMCQQFKSCPRIVFTPGTSTIITEWTLICDRAWIASLIISIQMVGEAIGSYTGGYLGDRFGRKFTVYPLALLCAVCNLIGAFSVSIEMFTCLRLVIGFCVGGLLANLLIIPLEVIPGKWRTLVMGFPAWYIHSGILGVIVWLLKDWRHAHIATAVASFLVLLTALWVPESIRWLVVNDKSEQAKMVARKMCRYNRRPCPESKLVSFTERGKDGEDEQFSVGLLFHRVLVKRTILGSLILFVVAISYYAVAFGIHQMFGNFYVNFIVFSVVFIPATVLIPLVGNKLGRRWGSLVFLGCAAILAFCVMILSLTTERSMSQTVITVLALASTVCVGCAWSVIDTHLAELFPTALRTLSCGFMQIGARVGGILAPFLIPQDPGLLYLPYLIMGLLTALCCAMIYALPETNGLEMDDTILEAEKKILEMKRNRCDPEKRDPVLALSQSM